MADIKISQLGAAIAVNDSDLLPIVSSGSTLKASASQVKEYAVGNTDLTGLGDGTPTGAISALNTAKQPKTLATPITIGGTQQTTVEEALGGLNTESQSLKQALTNVSITGTTNNTGSTILKGTFFYLNGSLVKSKVDIANGATLTENTNYETLSKGALNDIVGAHNFSTSDINLLSYTSISNYFTIPSDGYIRASYNSSGADEGQIRFILSNNSTTYPMLSMKPSGQTISLFVKKGMKVYLQNESMFYAALFFALENVN